MPVGRTVSKGRRRYISTPARKHTGGTRLRSRSRSRGTRRAGRIKVTARVVRGRIKIRIRRR